MVPAHGQRVTQPPRSLRQAAASHRESTLADELSADGTLRRRSIAGDEELRLSDTFQEHRAIEDPPPGAIEALEV